MKLLVSDFDSSFYTDDINIIKNVEELNKFKNNNLFMLSSGRSFNSLKNMCLKYNIPYDYLSCCDGSILYDKNDKMVVKYNLDESILNKFLNLKDLVNYLEIQYSYPDNYYNSYLNNDIIGCNIVVSNENINNNFLTKLQELQEKYKTYDFLIYDHVGITYFCLKNKGINKSTTVKYLEKLLNLDKNNIYTVGDSENDYNMLKDFKGYYIGNVNNRIKDVCIKGYNQVYELLDDLEKE